MNKILFISILLSAVQSFGIWSGNTIPKGDWTESVLIGGNNTSCTGVLIHSKVLLTAGHCTRLLNLKPGAKLSLSWTEYKVTVSGKMWTINVHPQFPQSFTSNSTKLTPLQAASDIAVIVFVDDIAEMALKKGISINYPRIGMDQNFVFENVRNQTTIAVGAGQTRAVRSNFDSSPVGKRWVTQGLRDVLSSGIWSAGSLEANKGVCSGDSGSGLFVKVGGSTNLVAIQSSVLNPKICNSTKNSAYYVPIRNHACWIARTLIPYNIIPSFDSASCR